MMVIVGGSIYYKTYQGSEYDKLAIPYIQRVVPILSSWDPRATEALMAPEIAETIPKDKFIRAMEFFSQLGSLEKMEKPEFEKAHIEEDTDIGKQTLLEYNVETTYENGQANLQLMLLERNGSLEIYRFNFSSETLLPKDE
jgi:hypothetical protein